MFKMRKNSLFAILLRSPWWISLVIALVLSVTGFALLPSDYQVVGVVSGLPFAVIAALALRRQWGLPTAARVTQVQAAVTGMAWPAFSQLLTQAFERDGYAVQAGPGAGVDFELTRQGRRMLVSARRWKSARTGVEALRPLQAAREAADDAPDGLYVGLGTLTDTARPYLAEHGIEIWQAAELAHVLRGVPLPKVGR